MYPALFMNKFTSAIILKLFDINSDLLILNSRAKEVDPSLDPFMPRTDQLRRLASDARSAERIPDPEDASVLDVNAYKVNSKAEALLSLHQYIFLVAYT